MRWTGVSNICGINNSISINGVNVTNAGNNRAKITLPTLTKIKVLGETYMASSVNIDDDFVTITDDVNPDTKIPISKNTHIEIVVEGNAENVTTSNGNITCRDVSNNVKNSNGNITCGDVEGNVTNSNGDIKAKKLKGKAKTSLGDIIIR